jgi:adenosine deaminase
MYMDFNALPKVELHCHLEGTLDLAMVRDILQEIPDFPINLADLERSYPVQGYERFFAWFKPTYPIFYESHFFEHVIARHTARLKAQNVQYAEIMTGVPPPDRSLAIETFTAFRDWFDQHQGDSLQVQLLLGLVRENPPEKLALWKEILPELYERGLIVGVALVGREALGPVAPLRDLFAYWREAGLGIEIHAGEWCGPESVWDALENGSPHRIGHGVSLFQDPRLVEVVRERGIHIEMCPTSNLLTGSIANIEEHPIGRAREMNLNFSVNTDDPGVFGCSMTSEYELLAERFGFEQDDFDRLYSQSLAARFRPASDNNPIQD